jgi:hypothetical protein
LRAPADTRAADGRETGHFSGCGLASMVEDEPCALGFIGGRR